MQVSVRLKWRKEQNRFSAYPVGLEHPERCAFVQPNVGRHDSWLWAVSWPGWFSNNGFGNSKQEAADAATDAWWAAVATPIPRDVDLEIDILLARVLVVPPPNHLYGETSDFLRKLMHSLRRQYEAEMRAETTPRQVADLMANLSAELFRRREAGLSEPKDEYTWRVT